jgi:hypothetical protein
MSRNPSYSTQETPGLLRWFVDAHRARWTAIIVLLATVANVLLWADWRGLVAGLGGLALTLVFALHRRAVQEARLAPVTPEARRLDG